MVLLLSVGKRRAVLAIPLLCLIRATNGFSICSAWSESCYAVESSRLFAKKKSRSTVGGVGFGSSSRTMKTKPVAVPPETSIVVTACNDVGPNGPHQGIDDDGSTSGRRPTSSSETSSSSETGFDCDTDKDDFVSETTKECHRQPADETAPQPKRRRVLVQISTSPLLFTVDDFIDPILCERVTNDGRGCFNLLFPERVADLLFNGQESELDGLLLNTASSADHHNADDPYPDGVHMDTNGQVLFRHVTCILYLNTVPEDCGGATVFPLARTTDNDPALAGARLLLTENISHTRSPAIASIPGAVAAAQSIEARVGGSNYYGDTTRSNKNNNNNNNPQRRKNDTALRIQPQAGRLLIFFSRDETGAEDPRAWHAGERIRRPDNAGAIVVEKRILTLFKQVDYSGELCQVQTTFADYLAPQIKQQRHYLIAKAQSAVPIEYGTAVAVAAASF
jgi:hypothetical protein